MNKLLIGAALTVALSSTVAGADEKRMDHYSGAPATSLAEALANLEAYNEHLAMLLAKPELSDADMGRIHQLSYTLENALQRIDDELEATEEALEAVHLGSEQLKREQVSTRGAEYLERSRLFTAK